MHQRSASMIPRVSVDNVGFCNFAVLSIGPSPNSTASPVRPGADQVLPISGRFGPNFWPNLADVDCRRLEQECSGFCRVTSRILSASAVHFELVGVGALPSVKTLNKKLQHFVLRAKVGRTWPTSVEIGPNAADDGPNLAEAHIRHGWSRPGPNSANFCRNCVDIGPN